MTTADEERRKARLASLREARQRGPEAKAQRPAPVAPPAPARPSAAPSPSAAGPVSEGQPAGAPPSAASSTRVPVGRPATPPTRSSLMVIVGNGGFHVFDESSFDVLPEDLQRQIASGDVLLADGTALSWSDYRSLDDEWKDRFLAEGAGAAEAYRQRAETRAKEAESAFAQDARDKSLSSATFDSLPEGVQDSLKQTHTRSRDGTWYPNSYLRDLDETEQSILIDQGHGDLEREQQRRRDKWVSDALDKSISDETFQSLPREMALEVGKTHTHTQDGVWEPNVWLDTLNPSDKQRVIGQGRSGLARATESAIAEWVNDSTNKSIPAELYNSLPADVQRQIRTTHVQEGEDWLPKSYALDVAEAQALAAARQRSSEAEARDREAQQNITTVSTETARRFSIDSQRAAAILTEVENREYERELAQFKADNVQLGSGDVYISKADYARLNDAEKRIATQDGYDALVKHQTVVAMTEADSARADVEDLERQYDRELRDFQADNVLLADGQWVRRKDYDTLDARAQVAIKTLGLERGWETYLKLNEAAYSEAKSEDGGLPKPTQAQLWKELGLSLIPIYGTYRTSTGLKEGWEDMSAGERVAGVAAAALSAVGDVVIVAGGVKIVASSLGGGKAVVQGVAVTSSEEAVKLQQVASKQKGPAPSIIIERDATEEGVKSLARTDDALRDAQKSLTPQAAKEVDRATRGILKVDRPLTKAQIDALAGAVKSEQVHRVTVRVVQPPSMSKVELKPLQASARDLGRALEREGVSNNVETLRLGRLKPGAKVTGREVLLEEKGPAGAIDWSGGGNAPTRTINLGSGSALRTGVASAPITYAVGRAVVYRTDIPAQAWPHPATQTPSLPSAKPGPVKAPHVSPSIVSTPARISPSVQPAPSTVPSPKTSTPSGPAPDIAPDRRAIPLRTAPVVAPSTSPSLPRPSTGPGVMRPIAAPTAPPFPSKRLAIAPRVSPKPVPISAPVPNPKPTAVSAPMLSPTPKPAPTKAPVSTMSPRSVKNANMITTSAPFRLPGGHSLPAGQFPRVVSWPQGVYQYFHDLDEDKTWVKKRKGNWTRPSREGFRVVSTDNTPPKRRTFRMGFEMVDVYPDRLEFALSDRTFLRDGSLRERRLRDRTFRSRRRI